MSTLTWSPDVADAMVEAARRAHHGGEPVALEVTCGDGSTFTRTYAPAFGRFADSGPSSPAAHLPGMSTLIVGISGKKRHGKDTAAEALVRDLGFTRVAFGDALKEALYILDPILWSWRWLVRTLLGKPMRLRELVDTVGWEAAKEIPEVRRLLQRMGTEVGRKILGEDTWVRIAMETAAAVGRPVVITDVRHLNEAEAIRGAAGVLLRVERPSLASSDAHSSETELDGYDGFDAVLVNDGTVAGLHSAALAAVRTLSGSGVVAGMAA
ncbi:hypothetical protein [Cellulosimicrobium sp. NPDC057127]|uniref:deoxynucleotide monophosphate kinase family protein n=1 Tax=Cellulosimicrobium sp. NPDC057127 TaxID=3346026 RepID=UPI003631EB33